MLGCAEAGIPILTVSSASVLGSVAIQIHMKKMGSIFPIHVSRTHYFKLLVLLIFIDFCSGIYGPKRPVENFMGNTDPI